MLETLTVNGKHVYLKKQLDEKTIDLAACTCPPNFVSGEEGSVDCPVDDHRVRWLQRHWQFDDAGRLNDGACIEAESGDGEDELILHCVRVHRKQSVHSGRRKAVQLGGSGAVLKSGVRGKSTGGRRGTTAAG